MKSLPSEKIEPLIFKLNFTDVKYTNLLSDYFSKEWFEDNNLGDFLIIGIKYFQKYSKLPNNGTIDLLISKFFGNREDYGEIEFKIKTILDIDISNYDDEYLEEQVLTYLRNQGMYNTIMESIEEIEKTRSVDHCLEKMKKLTCMDFTHDLGLDYFEDLDFHLDEISKPNVTISTGLDNLDYICDGGFPRDGKCLITFIGESHIGKSLFLSNIASNMLKDGKFLLIISLEMCENIYGKRIDSHLSKMDINGLKSNVAELKEKIENIKTKKDSKLIIKEYPPSSVTCNHLKNYIDRVISTYGRKPDAIFIDYINLLIPNGGQSVSGGTYEKIGKVTQELRSLSYIYSTPVITVSQVNRSGYNTVNPGMDNISESMGIAHASDFIGSIWQGEGDREAQTINMTILKNRFGGRIGSGLRFSIDYSNLIIKDIKSYDEIKNKEKENDSLSSYIDDVFDDGDDIILD
jgi:archaellum biogenesis ATPase FlaH